MLWKGGGDKACEWERERDKYEDEANEEDEEEEWEDDEDDERNWIIQRIRKLNTHKEEDDDG